jgi:hypothetical protein
MMVLDIYLNQSISIFKCYKDYVNSLMINLINIL